MTLTELYVKNKVRYVRKIYPYLHNQEACEDVVQEAFVKALDKFHTFDCKKSGLATWFNKVLFSVLWNYKRSLKQIPPAIDILDVLDAEDFAYYEDTELSDILSSVKNKGHQKVLVAHFILGYDYKEVASHLSLTQDNVRKIVQRFREEVK